MDVQSFTAFRFIKADDGTQARIFSHIESCFRDDSGENVSNDYAGIVSYSRVSVEELESDNSVSEALDLTTLANTRHNVEAGCRQYKHFMTLPT